MGETICVAAELVDRVLPHITGMLNDAVKHCGDWTLDQIVYALQGEQALLWVISDGKTFNAAAVSQLVKVPRGKICQVVACGGSSGSWPEAIGPIEVYAKAEGCVSMRISGRPGWSRVFKDYRLECVCLEKGLD